MSDLVRAVAMKTLAEKKKNIDDFKAGDTVGVYVRVREGEKERVQLYRGIVIKVQGSGITRSFTVRKISSGIGVERTFPFNSPAIDRVQIIAHGKVRRSRLYYLRKLRGKAATITSELATPEKSAKNAAPASVDEPVVESTESVAVEAAEDSGSTTT